MTDEELDELQEDLKRMREDTRADLREHSVDPAEFGVELDEDAED